MALIIRDERGPETPEIREAEPETGERIATQRLYRTADDRVVFEGDSAAAFLLCIAGEPIPEGYDEPGAEPELEPEHVEPAEPEHVEPEPERKPEPAHEPKREGKD